ncbi:nitrilase-related carbon-nitrogen hydrolase [Fodinicurvata sediminis]|uniref:nitrilase-related carbon-nitrogen hydrolase n=1 Tax=Fodinicurvata sediminis TaxID=1121832 RepID=UPI0003B39C5C|nr:nitrilase-related carbon-nitrogen hydrolase [Fodinicurvata sediminis]
MNLKVAAAQTESIPGDPSVNLDKHLEYIHKARAEGNDVLLFPEMSLTGHSAGTETLDVSRHREDEIVQKLADASGEMCTVFGLIEEGPAAQFYNSSIAVRQGKRLFLHRKVNLATYGNLEDGKHFAPGRYVDTFPAHHSDAKWRGSILICADLWNPPLVHLAALHGATVMFAPISSAVEAVGGDFDNPAGWDIAARFYGMTYGMPLVMTNRVGREGKLSFWGGSRIIDPFGRILAQAGNGEEMITANLDYDRIRKARYLLPTVRDSNLSLLLREGHRLADLVGVPDSLNRHP